MKANAGSQSTKASHGLPNPQKWSGRRHIVDTKDLTLEEIGYIINQAKIYKQSLTTDSAPHSVLPGKIVANLFYETSTRTRLSFELAGKHLGMNVVNLDVAASSVSKGETLGDTARTLAALGVHVVVQRHSLSGSAQN